MPTISFHWYGFIIGIAIIVCFELSKRLAKDESEKKIIEDALLPLLVGGVVGGRLYHVLDQYSYYSSDPQKILYLNQGGMGIFGALIGGGIVFFAYLAVTKNISKIHNLAVNIFTVLPLGQAIGRIGNYINKELLGIKTDLPWAIKDSFGVTRHPLFFYEMVLNLILFLFLYFRPHKSQNIGLYLCGYGLIRLLLENYRESTDTWIYYGFPVARLISLFMILIGLFFYQKYAPKKD
jgi:phosphatidylglycerol---prolipoprotein diacylglyceryl transferase